MSCGIGLTTGEGVCLAGPNALKEQWHHRGRGKPPAPGTNLHMVVVVLVHARMGGCPVALSTEKHMCGPPTVVSLCLWVPPAADPAARAVAWARLPLYTLSPGPTSVS